MTKNPIWQCLTLASRRHAYLQKQDCMGDQMSKWKQLMQEVLSDVVWQVANHFQSLCATLPETRPVTCVL